MSLINEALKRAKQAPLRPPPAGAELALQPAVYASPARLVPGWIVPVMATGALFMAIWFLSLWWRRSHESVRVTGPQPAPRVMVPASRVTAPTLTPRPVKAPKAPEPSAPATVAAQPPVSMAAVASALPAATVSMVPAPTGPTQAPRTIEASPSLSPAGTTPRTAQELPSVPAQAQPSAATTPASNEAALSDLKVQGIFYRLSRASVLINGQTLFVGDEIDGAKVIAIERQSVHILFHGKTNMIKLR